MASSIPSQKTELSNIDISKYNQAYQNYTQILPSLESHKGWATQSLVNYQNIWLTPNSGLKGVILSQNLFNPQPTDIFLVTFPKAGTTWFKALIYAIVNRQKFPLKTGQNHPLLQSSPHDCVPFLEAIFCDDNPSVISSNLRKLESPRILASHCPYNFLCDQILKYKHTSLHNKIVYVCRNPKDVLVSSYFFMNKMRERSELGLLSLEEIYEMFCKGVAHFGPFWEHVLGYYKASLEYPKHVFFVTYEDMMGDPLFWVKKMADFLGFGFDEDEVKEGVIDEIIGLCSFDSMSNMKDNDGGLQRLSSQLSVPKMYFYREGKIGDWRKYLSLDMAKNLDEITENKLQGFKFHD